MDPPSLKKHSGGLSEQDTSLQMNSLRSSPLSPPTGPSSTKSENTSQQLVIKIEQPPGQEKGLDWLSLAPALIAAGVVVFGWWIVERFARARERRADLRALTNSFGDAIDGVLSDATKYYQTEGVSAEAVALAMSIKSKLSLISEQITVLRDAGLNIEVSDQLKQFRQAVTGGEFESATRGALQGNQQIFVSMAAAGQNLDRAVQLAFYRDLVSPRKSR